MQVPSGQACRVPGIIADRCDLRKGLQVALLLPILTGLGSTLRLLTLSGFWARLRSVILQLRGDLSQTLDQPHRRIAVALHNVRTHLQACAALVISCTMVSPGLSALNPSHQHATAGSRAKAHATMRLTLHSSHLQAMPRSPKANQPEIEHGKCNTEARHRKNQSCAAHFLSQ